MTLCPSVMSPRYPTLLLLAVAILFATAPASAQDDEPTIDRAAFPALPAIPEEIAAEVAELRQVVRRTNRCHDVMGDRDLIMEPYFQCMDWFEAIRGASMAVREHAVGTELIRRHMSPRGRSLPIRLFERAWFTILQDGGEVAVRYLIRAASLLEGNHESSFDLARLTFEALERLTWQPIGPIPAGHLRPGRGRAEQRDAMRDAWLAWFRVHGDDGVEAWRRDGIAAHRANVTGERSAFIALGAMEIWRSEAEDRVEVLRTALLNPHLVGHDRQALHGRAVGRRWGRPLTSQESYHLSAQAARARRELRRARSGR